MFITIILAIWIAILGYGFQRRVKKKVLFVAAILGTVLVFAGILNLATLQQYIVLLAEVVTTINLWGIVIKRFKSVKK